MTIYFYIYTVFYIVTIPTVYFSLYILIYTMLLKVKVQFNGCLCMQTRLSVELVIKMMLSTRCPYMVVLYMKDLMQVIVFREALKA